MGQNYQQCGLRAELCHIQGAPYKY